MSRHRRAKRLLGPALAAAVSGSAPGAVSAACQDLASLSSNFLEVYPTGGPVERFAGATGERVMDRLAAEGAEAESVVFLYSGDGPVTGARGRYLYLILDPGDCILHHDWIDGQAYDQAVGSE